MGGCLIAALVVGGVGLFFGVIAVIGAVVWSRSPQGRRIVGAIGDTAKLMQEAAAAPGAEELRTKGCREAYVIDMERMQSIVGLFFDAGATEGNAYKHAILCKASDAALTCDDVAATYASAVSETRPFIVKVQTMGGGGRSRCDGLYAEDGTLLRALHVDAGSGM